jgi:hypothetical protein
LKLVPRRTIRNERDLMRRNPLARLLFEHAGKACLADDHAATDLLQADDDHVCAVAVRAITSDDPRACHSHGKTWTSSSPRSIARCLAPSRGGRYARSTSRKRAGFG